MRKNMPIESVGPRLHLKSMVSRLHGLLLK